MQGRRKDKISERRYERWGMRGKETEEEEERQERWKYGRGEERGQREEGNNM